MGIIQVSRAMPHLREEEKEEGGKRRGREEEEDEDNEMKYCDLSTQQKRVTNTISLLAS